MEKLFVTLPVTGSNVARPPVPRRMAGATTLSPSTAGVPTPPGFESSPTRVFQSSEPVPLSSANIVSPAPTKTRPFHTTGALAPSAVFFDHAWSMPATFDGDSAVSRPCRPDRPASPPGCNQHPDVATTSNIAAPTNPHRRTASPTPLRTLPGQR